MKENAVKLYIKYNVLIVFILYCRSLLLLMKWDKGEVRDRFGGMGRLRCKV